MNENLKPLIDGEVMGQNLAPVLSAIRSAYFESNEIANGHELLNQRNTAMIRGQLRYFMVQACLWQAFERKELHGFEAEWNPLSGAFECLTLETPSFMIEPVHVPDMETKPKKSVNREGKVVSNQQVFSSMSTMLYGPDESSKIHLFLVHGNQSLDFISFVCLDTLEKKQPYLFNSSNLLLSIVEGGKVPHEADKEFSPELKKEVLKRVERAG
jgi:hypothetical protein